MVDGAEFGDGLRDELAKIVLARYVTLSRDRSPVGAGTQLGRRELDPVTVDVGQDHVRSLRQKGCRSATPKTLGGARDNHAAPAEPLSPPVDCRPVLCSIYLTAEPNKA